MIGFIFTVAKRAVIDLSILTIFFLLAPGIPPYNATFSSYSITPPLPLTGALEPNGELDVAERLFEGKFTGPESIAWKTHNEIFLSLHGGTIIKIFGKDFDTIARVTRIGPTCAGPWQEKLCGRPLGLRFAPDGKLLVVDAYYGIFSVDVDSGEKECLISPDQEIEGEPFKFANDLDIDSDGNIYWSDSSSIADLASGTLVLVADPTGRLIKYDPKTGSNVVLMKDIQFANGVQLSSNQDFVLLAECGRSRIHRYWLKGDMAGRSDIFLDGLPGMPDNIRPRPNGGFYISLVSTRLAGKSEPLIYMAENVPLFRKLMARLLSVAQLIIDGINKVFPHEFWERASYNALSLGPLMSLMKSNISIVVEVDENGNILSSLQGSTGRISQISETAHVGDNIFFGSPINKYLGRLYVGEPIAWEAEVIGGDYKVRMTSQGKEEEEPAPSSAEPEEPPIQDKPLFEAMGQGITMKEPNEDTEEVETDENEKLKDDPVTTVEVDSEEQSAKEKELEISTEHEETQDEEQSEQIKDQTVEEQQESEQVDSKEQIIESEQQDIETSEAGATEGENPVNLLKEEVTNAEEEVLDTDDAAKEEVKLTVDTVQEEIRESVDPVDSEVVEDDTVEESELAQDTGDVETDGVPHQSEEHIVEAATQYVEENVVDDVPQVEDSIAEAATQYVEENVVDDVPQVEDSIINDVTQQIEDAIDVQQESEEIEEKEGNQAPHVQESKDEL